MNIKNLIFIMAFTVNVVATAPIVALGITSNELTEKEQIYLEGISGKVLITGEVLKTEKESKKYLRMMLKGNHKTIRWSRSGGKEAEQKRLYDGAVSNAILMLSAKNKDSFDLALRVINEKKEYPLAVAAAAEVLGLSGEMRAIPFLKEVLYHPDKNVKYQAGKWLLALGDIDTALPALEELVKNGNTAALGDIFHGMEGKSWEERGIATIKKAVDYDNKESMALACLFMAGLNKKGTVSYDISKIEKKVLAATESIIKQPKWVFVENGYSDHRAMETLIVVIKEQKIVKAIPLLERAAAHPDASFIQRRAQEAIGYLRTGRRD